MMSSNRLWTLIAMLVALSANWIPLAQAQPGPHSAIANIDLPVGSTSIPVPSKAFGVEGKGEWWHYTVAYADAAQYLQGQLATGYRDPATGEYWEHCASILPEKEATSWYFAGPGGWLEIVVWPPHANDGPVPDGQRIDIGILNPSTTHCPS